MRYQTPAGGCDITCTRKINTFGASGMVSFAGSSQSIDSIDEMVTLNIEEKTAKEKDKRNGKVESNDNTYLRCLYTNAQSLSPSKLFELCLLCEELKPNIILLTETWFTCESLCRIDGYNVYRKDRAGHGGGVAIYVSERLVSNEISDQSLLKQLSKEEIEQTWCIIQLSRTNVLIGCIYRPPNSTEAINREINKSLLVAKQAVSSRRIDALLVAGDFNYPAISWNFSSAVTKGRCKESENFVRLLYDQAISQAVNVPTFQTKKGDMKNTLALILTDSEERVGELTTLPPLGMAEQAHLLLSWHMKVNSGNTAVETRKRYAYNRGNYDGLSSKLENIDWQEKLSKLNVQESYDYFCRTYDKLCTEYIPEAKSSTNTHKLPWSSMEIRQLKTLKKRLWFKNVASKWRNTYLADNYQQAAGCVRKTIDLFR
jgi:hypothetical protein